MVAVNNRHGYDAVDKAIADAEGILPGIPASEGERDPRWQAIIAVGGFIKNHPEEVWAFAVRWGTSGCDDLKSAIVCCLVEHLLEHHFDLLFPLLRNLVQDDCRFDYWTRCGDWVHGLGESTRNRNRLARLEQWCRERGERRASAKRRQREMWSDAQSWQQRAPLGLSRSAAQDRSPRRKPGGQGHQRTPAAPKGRQT